MTKLSDKIDNLDFNTSMVRLKASNPANEQLVIVNFNTSMVRLKVKTTQPSDSYELFQYLNGAIKRKHSNMVLDAFLLFQYLNGAIKRVGGPITAGIAVIDFNTSMVRLKEPFQE